MTTLVLIKVITKLSDHGDIYTYPNIAQLFTEFPEKLQKKM